MARFDVIGAKKAGYSDAEIADHLAEVGKFDAESARKSGYSDEEIIKHLSPASAGDVVKDVAKMGIKGTVSGLLNAVDMGGVQQDVLGRGMQSATAAGSAIAKALGGRGLSPGAIEAIGKAPQALGISTMPSSRKALAATQQFFGNPETEQGVAAETVGSFAPAAITGPGGVASRIAQVLIPGLATYAAQRATRGTPEGKYIPQVVAALTGMATAGGAAGIKNATARGLANKGLPTTEEIRKVGSSLYEQMKQQGVSIPKKDFDTFKAGLKAKLGGGDISHGLADQSKKTFDLILSKKGDVDFDKLDLLRRNASKPFAAGSGADSNDKRVAGEIVRSIDEFIQTLNPKKFGNAASLLKSAQKNWSTQAKSGMIEQEITKAKNAAGNMNVKLDEAIRARFKKLTDDERRMSQFNSYEQEAIRKVAKGGIGPDTLSAIGKLAPTNVLTALLETALAGGGHFGANTKLGIAIPIAGTAAKVAATPLTLARALEASKTVRRGTPLPRANSKAGQAGAISAYLANQQGQTQ